MTDLTLHHLRVTHRGRPLVDVSDLALRPGVPVTVIGESGSGKSLLAHALMGTLAASLAVEGAMTLAGSRLDLADRGNRRHLWGREIALLPQEPALALDPTMRVLPQVTEGVPDFRAQRTEAVRRARAALAGVGLPHVERSFPHTLSGGMAQRVAYAAATVGGARVLVVDEPSKGLDPQAVDRLADLLLAHVDGGGLLLTITHDVRLAERLGGHLAVMREATVVEQGPADRVLAAPAADYTRRLLGADPARWDRPWPRGTRPTSDGGVLVTGTGLSKSYGGRPLFTDLSLSVAAGERVAISGPSGSGKTTLGNVLLRLVPTDAGRVEHAPALGDGRVQKLYQDPALSFPPLVPLAAGLEDTRRRYDVPTSRVEGWLEEMGLPASLLDRRPGEVSGGELQRVAIVRAMLPGPALVLADEATSRLDLLTQQVTVDCLVRELDSTGCALLLVTHDAALAEALADRTVPLGQERDPAQVTHG